jgi:ATP-dependent DNA helicase PIF1
VNDTNKKILDSMPGEVKTYQSVNTIPSKEGPALPRVQGYNGDDFPVEFLNSIEVPGLPLHETRLKIGVPIILLRNMDPRSGLCNGTRLIVTDLARFVIKAKIMTGDFKGETVLIPRIALDHTDDVSNLPLPRSSLAHPRPFVAPTSQGQSLDVVALDLSTSVFSHGQLYVALSRATASSRVAILLPKDQWQGRKTKNVVFRGVKLD